MVPALETPPCGNQRPGVNRKEKYKCSQSSDDKGLMALVVGLPKAGDLQRILEHVRGRKEQLLSEIHRPGTPWPHPPVCFHGGFLSLSSFGIQSFVAKGPVNSCLSSASN